MRATLQRSPSLERIRKIFAEATAPLSSRALIEIAHVSYAAWSNHYRPYLLKHGEIHVSAWDRYQWGWAPAYSAGKGVTPRKPKAPPKKVATALWKERTGYVDPRDLHRRLAKPKDPALAALLGLPARNQKRQTAHNQEKQA